VSTPSTGPRCPRCHRPLAAWRLNHCLYCGENLPAEVKEGFQPPESLKWVERPELPPDVSKTFAMMKLVPGAEAKKSRSLLTVVGLVSIPLFAVLFYLLSSLVRRVSPAAAGLVLVAGVGVLGYLVWTFWKAGRT
jgi:hypothetical protein